MAWCCVAPAASGPLSRIRYPPVAQIPRARHRLRPTFDARLAVEQRQRIAHGLLGQAHVGGNLQVVQAFGHQRGQRRFTRRQLRPVWNSGDEAGGQYAETLERGLAGARKAAAVWAPAPTPGTCRLRTAGCGRLPVYESAIRKAALAQTADTRSLIAVTPR